MRFLVCANDQFLSLLTQDYRLLCLVLGLAAVLEGRLQSAELGQRVKVIRVPNDEVLFLMAKDEGHSFHEEMRGVGLFLSTD